MVAGMVATAPTSLREACRGSFLIGAAINAAQITGEDVRGDAIVDAQFDSISPENALKWTSVHAQPGIYDFDLADRYVAYGEKHHMFIVGHSLICHSQTPPWVYRDAKGNLLTREALLARMREHIQTVVGRYKGRIQSWDVVNEALNEDGTLRRTGWKDIIGDDYIEKAFEYAHEADPHAELTYNDYSLENEPKRNGVISLIKKLQAEGVPITSVGLEGHDNLSWPAVEQEGHTIEAFAQLGVKVVISELDMDVLPPPARQVAAGESLNLEASTGLNPHVNGLPQEMQEALAKRYADLFRVFLKHRDAVTRVTFWGVTDGDSWKNNWPVKGRTSYPLLFDRSGQPKPAFYAVVQAAAGEASR